MPSPVSFRLASLPSSNVLKFGANGGGIPPVPPDEPADTFTSRNVANDTPDVTPPFPVTPILNTVSLPLAQRQQARSVAEILTVLDRRTGYLQGQVNGPCMQNNLDGPIEMRFGPDSPLQSISAELTVPPGVGDTHTLHKSIGLAGMGHSAWHRPYQYSGAPNEIVGQVPVFARPEGGSSFSMNTLLDLLHSQPKTPTTVYFNNRPSVAVSGVDDEGRSITFTIDPFVNVGKQGEPNVRVVNFAMTGWRPYGKEEKLPEGAVRFPDANGEGGVVLESYDVPVATQRQLAGQMIYTLYQHLPGTMLSQVPTDKQHVKHDRAIQVGTAANQYEYTYPHGPVSSLAIQYRLSTGHYGPDDDQD